MPTWQCTELGLSIVDDGDHLVIIKDGARHRAERVPPSPQVAAPPQPPAGPALEPGGTTYRHPTGGEMQLPPGWQVTQSQLGLQLVPPDAAYTHQGPAEIYTVAAQPAPGIVRVDDPRIVAYVDGGLRALIPTLGPVSAPVPLGAGISLRWSGRNPMTGAELLAVALLRLGDGAVAGVIGVGERPRVEARLPVLERIFASFRRGEGRRDPALVGVWHHWSYRGGGPTSASTSSETRRTMRLGADGSVVEGSSHEGIGNFTGRDGYGNMAWSAGYASHSGDGRTGTWTAGDGGFYITWSDGTQAAWQYQLHGVPGQRRLLLINPGQRAPYEWTEQPIVV